MCANVHKKKKKICVNTDIAYESLREGYIMAPAR